MRIERLELGSFRSYVGTALNLASRRILIGGVNEAGKSTIRESLRWLLTGKARSHDGTHLDVEGLAPSGTNTVSVGAIIGGLGSVTREWKEPGPQVLTVEGFVGSPASQQQALYDALKTSEPFLHAILDTASFLRLHHAEAKALILGLLNVNVVVDGEPRTLENVDALYKAAFEDRRIAKLKLKAMTVGPKPEATFPPMDAIKERLATLRAELDGLNQQIGGTASRRQEIRREVDSIPAPRYVVGRDPEIETKIADTEERLGMMEADEGPDDELPPVPSNKPTHDLMVLRSRAEALLAHQPKKGCVLDTGVDCTVHKLKFTNRGKDILADLETRKPEPIPAPKPVSPLTAMRKDLDRLKATQASYIQADEEQGKHQATRTRLDAELSALPDTSEQDAAIAKVRLSIEKGEGIQKAAQEHSAALGRHDAALDAHKVQVAEVARLEALCDLLGPSGARVQALAAALDPFLAAINAFTQTFGWTVSIVAEPWAVMVNGRPVATYSKSAQYRIATGLQIAIAKLSGLNMICLDELDLLDASNREAVGKMLFASDLEQVLILGTREPGSALPNVSGMLAYRLAQKDGRSEVVEASGS